MTELLLAVLTPTAILSAILSGLVFGAALPWLFARLAEPYIPEEHIDALNRVAWLTVPFIAIPLGACFWLAQTVTEVAQGGPWARVLARFLVYLVFVAAVTIADLLSQRLIRRRDPAVRFAEQVEATDHETRASRERLAHLRAVEAQVTAQTARGGKRP